jgi:hypothetical protein
VAESPCRVLPPAFARGAVMRLSTHFPGACDQFHHPDHNAHLGRRSPVTTADGKGEMRTFECGDGKALTETFIPD